MHLKAKLKNGMEFLIDQVILSYGSKQSKYCFDKLKNRLAYVNFNAIFEFLG